jgi:hypothetical protein
MPANRSKVFLLAAALICVLLVAIWYGLNNWLGSSNFGKLAISAGGGSTVYVVRESWGLHSDEISLTRNPDGCVPPNPATDYIDTYGDGQSLVYSSAGDGLILYADSGPVSIHEPTRGWAGVKVSVQNAKSEGNDRLCFFS